MPTFGSEAYAIEQRAAVKRAREQLAARRLAKWRAMQRTALLRHAPKASVTEDGT